jgi:hypothetical protein
MTAMATVPESVPVPPLALAVTVAAALLASTRAAPCQ